VVQPIAIALDLRFKKVRKLESLKFFLLCFAEDIIG